MDACVEVEACAGESVTLPCLSTSRMGVDWRYRQRPTSYGDYVVASGHVQKKFEDRFSLNRTTQHQRSLVVSRLRKNDEGLYICIEDAGLGPRHQYQLTVRGQSSLASEVGEVIDRNRSCLCVCL